MLLVNSPPLQTLVENKLSLSFTDTLTDDHLIMEFKCYDANITDDYVIMQFDGYQYPASFSTMQVSGDCTIKIEIIGNRWYSWKDGTPIVTTGTLARDISSGMNLRFGLNGSSDGIKVSDIKIYRA